ncbi:MAG TPA: hypothetical protein EYN67_17830 [Flavobacteriales bacterium]|nr:hypothetical protein [Flavobacteriales bacterium]
MAILNYSGGLNAAGPQTTAQRTLGTAGMMQGLQANQQAMQQQAEQQQAQEAQLQKQNQARAEGAELLKNGTPDEIAEFGMLNPIVMKDFIANAQFKDQQAIGSRVQYAQNILSGNIDPRKAIEARVREVELAGGDASGLRRTMELGDEDIIKAAEKDLAVISPKAFSAYRKATGQDEPLTVKQKDFKKYQKLKETDPEAAEVFGAGAGFVKDDKQRVFQIIDGIKVFADGTEKPLGGNDKIKTPDMKASISRNQALNVVGKAKEYQTKSVGFAMRLRDSIDGMTALETGVNGEKVDPARAALINKALGDGTIANMSLSSGEQQYMVNAKDALFAILRPETGAAITDSEMAQYGQIYLPQPGDSKGTTKLKKRKLENQFRAIRDKAPRIYDATKVIQKIDKPNQEQQQIQSVEQGASTSNLSDADLLKKYGGQ